MRDLEIDPPRMIRRQRAGPQWERGAEKIGSRAENERRDRKGRGLFTDRAPGGIHSLSRAVNEVDGISRIH